MAETIISPGVFQRENDISFIAPAPVEAGAAILGPTVKGPVEVPTIVTSYNEFHRTFGVTFDSGSNSHEFLTSLAVKSYFDQGGNTCLVTRVVSGSFTAAGSTDISTDTGSISNPFSIETLGKGVIYNNSTGAGDPGAENSDNSLVSGSDCNVRWEIANVDSSKGTFTLVVRRGDDNHKNKIVLESFNNLSLDPNADNYIEKVVGNQSISKLTDNDGVVYIGSSGEFVNKSRYIRISNVSKATLNYLGTDGITILSGSDGVSYTHYLPAVQSGSFYDATGDVKPGANLFNNINTQTQGLVAADYADAITILGNSDEYLFNVISAPGLTYDKHSSVLDTVISLAETRGDCIAVVDLYSYGATVSNVTGKAALLNSSYAAAYWPWLQTASANGKNVWVPASTVIPGVFAFTDGAAAPWFAPAGLVRGGIPGVIQAERKLTRNDRDALYNGKVNPIATFPGTGIAVFGQKTLQTKASALDRVNVRRLLIELKKFIGDQAKNLVFEQNTIATRNKFLATVNPYLDSVVQRQGLYAYRVVMDDTNNAADVVDRNQLVGQIFIQPAKTAEFIVLDFVVEPTGATFGV
jgi:uncharacterized protein